MSLQGLVEAECGGANPLMQLANQVHSGNVQQRELGFQKDVGHQENMPHSFNMQSLLDGMQNIEQNSTSPPTKLNDSFGPQKVHNAFPLNDESFFDHAPGYSMAPQFNSMPPQFMPPPFMPPHFMPAPPVPQQTSQEPKYAHEYLDEIESRMNSNQTAFDILDSFESEQAQKKAEEEQKNDEDAIWNIHEEMAKEIEGDVEYWQKLQNDWTELFQQTRFQNEEDAELNGYEKQYNIDYDFEENNPFRNISNAFEKGLERLKEGDLISAILCFEEAVQVNPEHVEAWQYLGTSQAENEQEVLAIRALHKCLALQPDNLIARMNLAVSYTNEYLQVEAYKALKAWVQHNPSYAHLITNPDNELKSALGTSFLSSEMFEEIKNLYLSATQISPSGNIDPDVQTGLGVIYNISGEYDKAIDCFQAALQVQPDSAYLWNKLGATLANSSRSTEAIPAYEKALALRPGFIRCRYNLGISCINMKTYPEAVKHFLTALSMQKEGEDPARPVSTMSENIWSTLRMTISLLGRLDLMNFVEKKDLKTLNDKFDMNK